MSISAEQLRQVLDYDRDTGLFRWRQDMGARAKKGRVAGTDGGAGYTIIIVRGVKYKAHRLAWLYVTGEFPPHDIDHCNMVRSDNRFTNLRAATRAQNSCNVRARKSNACGFKGVSASGNRFQSRIRVDGQSYYLGLYQTPEAAHAAYVSAAAKLHGDFARAA